MISKNAISHDGFVWPDQRVLQSSWCKSVSENLAYSMLLLRKLTAWLNSPTHSNNWRVFFGLRYEETLQQEKNYTNIFVKNLILLKSYIIYKLNQELRNNPIVRRLQNTINQFLRFKKRIGQFLPHRVCIGIKKCHKTFAITHDVLFCRKPKEVQKPHQFYVRELQCHLQVLECCIRFSWF
jgi:hypothetical protein